MIVVTEEDSVVDDMRVVVLNGVGGLSNVECVYKRPARTMMGEFNSNFETLCPLGSLTFELLEYFPGTCAQI